MLASVLHTTRIEWCFSGLSRRGCSNHSANLGLCAGGGIRGVFYGEQRTGNGGIENVEDAASIEVGQDFGIWSGLLAGYFHHQCSVYSNYVPVWVLLHGCKLA